MKKNLAFGLVVISVFLLLSATFASTKAASYTQLGVHTGDTADYTYKQDIPAPINASNAARINFTSVSGTYIRITLTTYYPNQTVSSTNNRQGDVSIGGNYTYLYAIATNLAKDDPIFSGATMKINETIILAIAGGSRIVNHFVGTVGAAYYDLYWDKETGLMVKANQHLLTDGHLWQNLTLTSTTVFSFGFDPVLLVLVGGAIGVVVVAAIIIVRRRK
jgi:hypothetical protein